MLRARAIAVCGQLPRVLLIEAISFLTYLSQTGRGLDAWAIYTSLIHSEAEKGERHVRLCLRTLKRYDKVGQRKF